MLSKALTDLVLNSSVAESYQWRGSLAVGLGDPEGLHSSASSSQYWCFSLVRHEPAIRNTKTPFKVLLMCFKQEHRTTCLEVSAAV